MSTNPSQFRRKKILVNFSLQIKYTILTMALVGLACFMVWWETYRGLMLMVENGTLFGPTQMSSLGQINSVVLLKVLLLIGVVSVFSFLISHYIAGPIYRFEKGLKALARGDFNHRIYLRKRDEFKSIGQSFNVTLEAIEKMNLHHDEKVNELSARLDKLVPQADKKTAAALLKLVKDLRLLKHIRA